jgi:hypothetical protein
VDIPVARFGQRTRCRRRSVACVLLAVHRNLFGDNNVSGSAMKLSSDVDTDRICQCSLWTNRRQLPIGPLSSLRACAEITASRWLLVRWNAIIPLAVEIVAHDVDCLHLVVRRCSILFHLLVPGGR